MVVVDGLLHALDEERERTLQLVAPLSDAVLDRQFTALLSPLAWDLGHIAAYEDLWINQRHGGRELLRDDLAEVYDAFETPRSERGDAESLDAVGARAYLDEVRERTVETLARRGPSELVELVLRHELQHRETMLQALQLHRPEAWAPRRLTADPCVPPGADGERIAIPAAHARLGAEEHVFAYDNERPRHQREVPAFAIARRPVTNASYLHFVEGGGYERRTLWTEEAWQWKEEYDITHPVRPSDDPNAPVVHVSWFEAAAYARAQGARLPTEAEWERAATWDQEPLEGRGQVWEWTGTEFTGYPGFTAYPYREYSEVFFDKGYRVLRGGSWATAPRVATTTFRNWDLPIRRQIFSGLRLAWDAEAAG